MVCIESEISRMSLATCSLFCQNRPQINATTCTRLYHHITLKNYTSQRNRKALQISVKSFVLLVPSVTNVYIFIKGACSEIFGILIFFKVADTVTFPTKISSMVKKLQICISFVSNLRKRCLCYLLFYKWWKPRFLISKRVFRWFLLN